MRHARIAICALSMALPVLMAACRQVLGIDDGATVPTRDAQGTQPEDGASMDVTLDGASRDSSLDTDHRDSQSGEKGDGSTDAECGNDCPIERISDNAGQATVVAVSGSNVYFGDDGPSNGAVFQCPKTGCVGKPLRLGEGYTRAIVVHDAKVYWTDYANGHVLACPVGGCSDEPTIVASSAGPRFVASDGHLLVWDTSDGEIRACELPNCASPFVVAGGQGKIDGLTIATNKVYWTPRAGSIYTSPLIAGSTPTLFAAGDASQVTVHLGRVYWIRDNAIISCTADSCSDVRTIGASTAPAALALDSENLYWRDRLEGRAYACSRVGCQSGMTVFAEGPLSAESANLVIDGNYVYWTTGAGVVRKRKL